MKEIVIAEIPTRGGKFRITMVGDAYIIYKDEARIKGPCTAHDVIGWRTNALFDAEQKLMKVVKLIETINA